MPNSIDIKIKEVLRQLSQLSINVNLTDVQKKEQYKLILEKHLPSGYLLIDETEEMAEHFKQDVIRVEFTKALDLLNANNVINSELVRATELNQMLHLTCSLLVEVGKLSMAWIGWNNEETKQLDPTAVYGDTNDYVSSIKIFTDDRPEGMGPSGIAFKTQKTMVVHNADDHPGIEPWKAARIKTNLISSIAVPIVINAKSMGVLMVYAEETNFFGEKEVKLLEALALNLQNAIEREKYKKSLLENEQRLANVIEGASVGIWEWNVQTGETIFNEQWANMLGYTLQELQPTSLETWRKLTHPDDGAKALELIESHFRNEISSYTIDLRMKHKNGSWVWILDCGRVIKYDSEGKPQLMFGIHTYIHPRKQAEESLKLSEEKFRGIFDNSLVGLAFRGIDGSLHVNDEYCNLLGYNREELSQLSWQDITHPDDREEGEKIHQALISGKIEFAQRKKRYLRKDGSSLWVEIKMRTQKDSEGKPLYVITSANKFNEPKPTPKKQIKKRS